MKELQKSFDFLEFFQLYPPLASYIASQLYSATPRYIRFASIGGEYNIAEAARLQYNAERSAKYNFCRRQKYHEQHHTCDKNKFMIQYVQPDSCKARIKTAKLFLAHYRARLPSCINKTMLVARSAAIAACKRHCHLVL